jgi:hypothetical protein
MTVDIRCDCTCDLGPIISGGISDDHVQDAWLIKTKGTLIIDRVFVPAKGKRVRLAYSRGGYVAPFPRVLTVLRSTADPHRRVTTVEVGCPLTLLEDLKAPELISAGGALSSWYGGARTRDNPVPISANSLMLRCLLALGLPLAAGSEPLVHFYMKADWDLSDGYVASLQRLLESESRFGYVTAQGEFRTNRLNLVEGAPGPLFGWRDLASIEPIGGAVPPVERVEVSHRGRNAPASADDDWFPSVVSSGGGGGSDPSDQRDSRDWERDVVRGTLTPYTIPYTNRDGISTSETYYHLPESETLVEYTTVQTRDRFTGRRSLVDIVNNRRERTTSCVAAVNGPYVRWALENDAGANGGQEVVSRNETLYFYESSPDGPLVSRQETREYVDGHEFIGSLGIQDYTDIVIPGEVLKSLTVIRTFVNESADISKTVTERYLALGNTQEGEQLSASVAQGGVASEINEMVSAVQELKFEGVEVRTSTGRGNLQISPSRHDLIAETNDPYGSTAKLQLVSFALPSDEDSWASEATSGGGSNFSLRRELPHSPDDWWSVSADDPGGDDPLNIIYNTRLERTQADLSARRYAVAINSLLYGHAHGRAIIGDPWRLPTIPLSPIYIQEGGIVAGFRVNGTSWAISNNGIAVGTDALFCGAVAREDD